MNEHTRLALLVTDSLPAPSLLDAMKLAGYEIDLVHTVDAAYRLLTHRVPSLVLAGPFRHETPDLHALILQLVEQAAHVIVISDDPPVVQLADQLGVQVRSPSAELLETVAASPSHDAS